MAHQLETISAEYRDLVSRMHAERRGFGSYSARHADLVTQWMRELGTGDVLDYGCGKGALVMALSCRGYDPCVEQFSAPPEPADLVVCTDVLEHIEPERLDSVLEHIASLARMAALFIIATRPAKKVLPDGRNAHLIVMNAGEWQRALRARWDDTQVICSDGREVVAVCRATVP